MKPLTLALMILVGVGVAAAGYAQDFTWESALAKGKALEIKGVNGNIIAKHADGDVARVTAKLSYRLSDPKLVRIETVKTPTGVTICAVYPGFGNNCTPGPSGRMNVRKNDVKVDFWVQVPDGVQFIAQTVNGRVEALSLTSDVKARSVNGSVKISATGHAEASTVNGSVEAILGSVTEAAEFTTVNGGVTLTLPDNATADIRADTMSGAFFSDFPLQVKGGFLGKSVRGSISGGGPRLTVRTVNGSIYLRKFALIGQFAR
jgi:hypothetical protein